MMRSTTTFLLGALLPILASSTDVPSSTSQVIVPFSTLPLCAQSCGVLFDVQGACGQTELTATSQSCFCNDSRLASFKSGGGTSAVCPASGCDSADSTSIQDWFTTYCASSTSATTTASGTATATKSGTSSTSTGKSSSSTSSSSNATASNTWLASHYQYVIMIVVIVVGLALLWIGGVWLRRRHDRKRDLQYELRPPLAPWGPNSSHEFGPNGVPPPMSQSPSQTSIMSGGLIGGPHSPSLGYGGKGRSPLSKEVPAVGHTVTNLEAGQGGYDEKSGRRLSKLSKWMPKERT